MYAVYSNRNGRPEPVPGSRGSGKPDVPGRPPASPTTGSREETLREILRQEWAEHEVRLADVIYAVDQATDERRWLFYGDVDLAGQPVDPMRPQDRPFVLDVRVDRDGDDLKALDEAVRRIKGACHYVGELGDVIENPYVLVTLAGARIVYGVDYLTGRRCGLYFGDPATEPPFPAHIMPWESPLVVEFCLHRGTDEPVVLAEVVRRVKGSCTDRAES